MRICMLVRNSCVRDARVLRETRALASAGHEVTVLAVLADDAPERETRDGFTIERLDPIPEWMHGMSRARPSSARASSGGGAPVGAAAGRPWLRTLVYDRVVTDAFARAALARPADAYHAHDLNMLPAAARAAVRHRARLVYDAHELYPEMNGLRPAERARWARVERRLIRRADRVITVNEAIADELVRRYGIARPVVVMNVPDVSERDDDAAVPPALRQPGRAVLYVGWLTFGRGIEQAIAAMPLVEDARLVLLGPERRPWGERLHALAQSQGVAERVAFAGAVPPGAVARVASHATVGLVTIRNVAKSYYLSLPNKLFEYLHGGIPIVASDFPEIRRIVERYDVGALCDPENPSSIAAAIHSVIDDPERYERLRENARAAAADLTWDREREKLLAVYA